MMLVNIYVPNWHNSWAAVCLFVSVYGAVVVILE